MKIAIVLLFSVLCTSAFAGGVNCPTGGAGSGEAPKISWPVGGLRLLVCGSEDDAKVNGSGKHLAEFDVYAVKKDGVVSKSLKTAMANDHYLVSGFKGGLRFDQLVFRGEEWVPALRTKLTCRAGECSFSKEACVLKKKKTASLAGLHDLQSYIDGKNKGQVPDEAVVTKAAGLALSGNQDAQKVFLEPSPELKLDGASAEVFREYRNELTRMTARKCL